MDEKEIVFPVTATTWTQQAGWLFAAQEKLRREHNAMGIELSKGNITLAEWEEYLETDYNPRDTAVSRKISQLKHTPTSAALAEVDLDVNIKTKTLVDK